jgi:hypothetical protein
VDQQRNGGGSSRSRRRRRRRRSEEEQYSGGGLREYVGGGCSPMCSIGGADKTEGGAAYHEGPAGERVLLAFFSSLQLDAEIEEGAVPSILHQIGG